MPHPDPRMHEHHLVPLLDVGWHVFDEECPCGAWSDVPGSVVHQAYDGRLDYEQGKRRRH